MALIASAPLGAMQGNQLYRDTDLEAQLQLGKQRQDFAGKQSVLDRALQQSLLGETQGFQGQQAGLERDQQSKMQGSELVNRLQLASLPIDFAREKFNQVFPMVSGALPGVLGGGEGGFNLNATSGGGGPGGGAPNSIYSPQQIEQNVNAMKSGNAQASGTQQRANATANAAGGFGSNSPLLAALNNQTQMGTLAANATGERQTRQNAAEANAKQGLAATTERDQANAQFQQNAVAAQGNALQSRSSLLAALAGML